MFRKVSKMVLSREQSEGRGAKVRRSIGNYELRQLDPFLMLDEFGFSMSGGFPDHPHRGFQTVTYMLDGAFHHEDFCGHEGIINSGDVQWMTAGRGIVHSEMPASNKGLGLQLWVNLSSKDKMVAPSYQELKSSEIPSAKTGGVSVKVIAGESMGQKSPIRTLTPTHYLDFNVEPGAEWTQPTPVGWTAFAYVLSGTITFGTGDSLTKVGPHHTVVFTDGESIRFHNEGNEEAHFVLIAGKPIGEPVVQRGPFVLNTWQELEQAFLDYQTGTNGFENATKWQSKYGK